MTPEDLGVYIASKRKENGLTQKEMADLLHITPSAISRWERGLGYPDFSMIDPLAHILNIPVEALIYGKNEDVPVSTIRSVASKEPKDSPCQQISHMSYPLYVKAASFLLAFILFHCFLLFIPMPKQFEMDLAGYQFSSSENTSDAYLHLSGWYFSPPFGSDRYWLQGELDTGNDLSFFSLSFKANPDDDWHSIQLKNATGIPCGNCYYSGTWQKVALCSGSGYYAEDFYLFTNDPAYNYSLIYNSFRGES